MNGRWLAVNRRPLMVNRSSRQQGGRAYVVRIFFALRLIFAFLSLVSFGEGQQELLAIADEECQMSSLFHTILLHSFFWALQTCPTPTPPHGNPGFPILPHTVACTVGSQNNAENRQYYHFPFFPAFLYVLDQTMPCNFCQSKNSQTADLCLWRWIILTFHRSIHNVQMIGLFGPFAGGCCPKGTQVDRVPPLAIVCS